MKDIIILCYTFMTVNLNDMTELVDIITYKGNIIPIAFYKVL